MVIELTIIAFAVRCYFPCHMATLVYLVGIYTNKKTILESQCMKVALSFHYVNQLTSNGGMPMK